MRPLIPQPEKRKDVRSVSVVTAIAIARRWATVATTRPVAIARATSVARTAPITRTASVAATPVLLLALRLFDHHKATLFGRSHGELYSLPVELMSNSGW